MTSSVQGSTPPPPTRRSGWQRWWPWLLALAVVGLLLGLVVWWLFLRVDFGSPTRRIASPTGEYEVVQYEFSAMIDPGWNLAIERAEGEGRQWFWRSVEHRSPEVIRFTVPTSVEVVDEDGGVYRVEFDPDSLEPNERYCLRPDYCDGRPWNDYTRDAP